MEITRLTFRKEERLKSSGAIASVFQQGQVIISYPLKIVWKFSDIEMMYPAQAAFSVSSRVFKKATTRNLLKRRMREAYRLSKNEWYNFLGENKINILFIYIAKEELEYQRVEKSMMSGLKKIIGKLPSPQPKQ